MAMDPRENLIHNDVRRLGWHVVRVNAGAGEPAYAYSIGLQKSFAQPEIIVFGLPPATLQAIIDRLAADVRGGARFAAGDRTGAALEDCQCTFREVPERFHASHFGYAVRFYGDAGFNALQCIWPDRRGCYPWEPEFDEELRPVQSVLAEPAHDRRPKSG